MNPRQFNYILAVAEEKSISAAAKKLYVAQPSLSELIKRVEEELGYELFDRTTTPLKLTAAGEIYVEAAKEIQNINHVMRNRLHDIDGNQYGKLVVGVWPNSGIMPSVMKRFFEVFPGYDMEIRDSFGTAERLRLLEEGVLDLCIQPVYDTLSSKFDFEQVGIDELVLVVPSEFSLNDKLAYNNADGAALPVIELDELHLLNDVPFMTLNVGMRLRRRIDKLFDQAGVAPHIKMTNHKCEGCLDMAMSGICVTILQSSFMKFREPSRKVKCYKIHQDNGGEVIGAIYVRNRYLSKAAQTLIDILKTI